MYTVSHRAEDAAVIVTKTKQPVLTLTVHLTSPVVRIDPDSETTEEGRDVSSSSASMTLICVSSVHRHNTASLIRKHQNICNNV